MKRTVLTVASLSLLTVAGARAATVVGMNGYQLSQYTNPFDLNNDGVVSGGEATMTAGANGPGTVGVAGGYYQGDLVNRHDSYISGVVRITDSGGIATSGFIQYQAATSFNAGTVIAYQNAESYWDGNIPYTLKLDGTTVQTGPGIRGTAPIQVTTFPGIVNANTLRVDVGMSTYQGGASYGEMNEVLILPRRLDRIAATVTQTAGTSWFNPPQAVSDLDGYGWGGFSNPSLKLDFGHATNISTLVVANFDSSGGPVNFNIKNDLGTVIGNVQLAGGANGEFIPINFATPVLTSFLTFDFTDVTNGRTAMREIMVFTDSIPEPSTVLLLGLGGLFLWRRMRKAAVTSNQ